MQPFMFVIKAVPTPTNVQCEDIAGANVHIWVIATDILVAEERAMKYLSDYHWTSEEIEHAFAFLPGQLLELDKSQLRLYHTALQHGIAAQFVAWPKNQGKHGDPVELRPLRKFVNPSHGE